MPTTAVSDYACGTDAGGWVSGAKNPLASDGIVTRTVRATTFLSFSFFLLSFSFLSLLSDIPIYICLVLYNIGVLVVGGEHLCLDDIYQHCVCVFFHKKNFK